ncbi:MAG: hypothetical protein EXS09_04740 [Gemmataceae bacterium]|nr:hypothetical protein [Gemmataceae bacterium]
MRHTYLLPIAFICSLQGCSSSERAEVFGTVILNGVPIEEGSISFIPIEGNLGPEVGAVIRDGRFHIPRSQGVMVGKNRVELKAFRNSGRKVQDPTGRPGTLAEERVPAFSPEYNERSTLIRDVNKGSNTIDFDIRTTP